MKHRYFAVLAAIGIAGASGTTAADDMFLRFVPDPAVGEIRGDSVDPQHPNEIVVLAYSLGITAESSWSSGGGAAVGKPNPGKLNFEHYYDTAVPAMVKYITTGRSAPSATLTLRSAAKNGKPGYAYAKYTFEDFFFTSVGQLLGGEGRAVSAFGGVYKAVTVQTFAPGNPVAVSCVRWEVPSGTTTDCR